MLKKMLSKGRKLFAGIAIGSIAAVMPVTAVTAINANEVRAEVTASSNSKLSRIFLNNTYQKTIRGSSAAYYVFKTTDVKSDYNLLLQNDRYSSQAVGFQVYERKSGEYLNIKTTEGLDVRTLPGNSYSCTLQKTHLKANTEYIIRIFSASSVFGDYYRFRLNISHVLQGKRVNRSENGKWVFYNNGKADYSYTGVAHSTTGNWVFVKNGIFTSSYTGVARSTTGNWVYVKNGKFYTGFTGLAKSTTGNIVYVKKGRFYPKYNGTAKYNGKYYTVRNGKVVK